MSAYAYSPLFYHLYVTPPAEKGFSLNFVGVLFAWLFFNAHKLIK